MKHIEVNKTSWDNKVDVHVNSEFYDQKGFLEGRNSLNKIELDLLGYVTGKKILHLQCHFGQDSLSLSRMGADVVGVDFSQKAISVARKTNDELGLNARFICCEVHDLPNHLSDNFDIVFASYGVIGWHPELKSWSALVSHFLAPGGRYILAEFHPSVWMWSDDFDHVQYSYFNKESIVEEEEGTYAQQDSEIRSNFITWNHSIEESIMNAIDQGLVICSFKEYDYSPYNFLKPCIEAEIGYHIKGFEGKLPLVFSLVAEKVGE